LVGVGFQADSTEIGGHSFFGDAAGTFGLVGFVPIAAFFLLIVFGLARARRRAPMSWPVASSQIFIWALMLGLVINPYLLFLGLSIADTETVANQGGQTPALGRSS
jgi:O-antigen ligase